MVKLRVAARVIPETDYNNLQSSSTAGRKFLVVVRNPEDCDLGKIKYLKNADDFDLDTEQFVADVFVNEGKANKDGLDQDATIKVIQEQGQAIRYGSVVPDLAPIHYQKPPAPPVPRFSDVPSSLGKRSYDHVNGGYIPSAGYAGKITRLGEIDETQQQDELLHSVERSPELIEDTQTSPDHDRRVRIKLESPEFRRSFHKVVPATADELEFLPEKPPDFPHKLRDYVLGDNHLTPKNNGIPQNTATRFSAANRHSQVPITPPTDPSTASRVLSASEICGRGHGSKSPAAAGASSTSNRFRSARRNLYDMPESDIEDSQMSPRANDYQRIPRLVKISSIETTPGHQQITFYNSFNAQSAMDPMDMDGDEDARAFIAEKRLSVSQHNDFGNRGDNAVQAKRDEEDEETEDPALVSDHKHGESSQGMAKPNQNSPFTTGKAAASNIQLTGTTESTRIETESRPMSSSTVTSKKQASSEDATTAPKKRRKRKADKVEETKRRESFSGQASQGPGITQTSILTSPNPINNPVLPSSAPNIFERIKARRRSSDLDSPSEQLTQDLRNSERRYSPLNVNTQIAIGEGDDEFRPSTRGSASTTTPTSRRSSSSKIGMSPGRLGLGITDTPRKKKDRDRKVDEQTHKENGDLSLTQKLKKAKEDEAKAKNKQNEVMKKPDDVVLEDNVLPSVGKPSNSKKADNVLEIDFDKQCAVKIEDGKRCKRNLACTNHNRGDKRAVPGRSAPFDELLKKYEKAKTSTSIPAPGPKGKASSPLPLPEKGSGEKPATVGKIAPSATPEAGVAVISKELSSSSRVIPPWMTAEEYERLTKGSENTQVPQKGKTAAKGATKAATPAPAPARAPEIKVVTAEEDRVDDGDSNDTDDEDDEEPTRNLEEDESDENGVVENPNGENESDEDDEEDDSEGPQPVRTPAPTPKPNSKTLFAKVKTPFASAESSTSVSASLPVSTLAPAPVKSTAKSTGNIKNTLSVPATDDRSRSRSSATPADDFNAITAKLKSVNRPSPDLWRAASFTSASDAGNLQPRPPLSESALKKARMEKDLSVSDMISSVVSSDNDATSTSSTNASVTKKSANKASAKTESANTPATAKKTPALKSIPKPPTLPKTTSNISATTTTTSSGSTTGSSTASASQKQKKVAAPAASTPTPGTRAAPAATALSSSAPKASARPSTIPVTPAPPSARSGLQALRAALAQQSREQETARGSPAGAGAGANIGRARGLGGLGKKKVFSESEEESESSSSDESSEDDSDKDRPLEKVWTGKETGPAKKKETGTLKGTEKETTKWNEQGKAARNRREKEKVEAKLKAKVYANGLGKKKTAKKSIPAVPDRSIRDVTPEDESSDED